MRDFSFRRWLAEGKIGLDLLGSALQAFRDHFPKSSYRPIVLDRHTPRGTRNTSPVGYSIEAPIAGRVVWMKVFYDEPYDQDPTTLTHEPPTRSGAGHGGYAELGFFDEETAYSTDPGEDAKDDTARAAYQAVGAEVRTGSKLMMDKIKAVWAALKGLGIAVAYDPMERPDDQLPAAGRSLARTRDRNQRGRLYSKMLTGLGFRQAYSGPNKAVWEPGD
jgi:hypothetical protein